MRFASLGGGGEGEGAPFTLGQVQLNEGMVPVTVLSHSAQAFRLPAVYCLRQNVPNPFNAVTAIRFDLPEAGEAELTIYNLSGQRIRTLVDGPRDAGRYSVVWDGRDAEGREVASGIYLVRMAVNDFVQCRKMVVIK